MRASGARTNSKSKGKSPRGQRDNGELRGLWRRFWARAPRQLRVTRDGKVLIGLTFFVGFAAVNTGNNLLFLGWSLMLSAIVLSGLLSEATLRPLQATVSAPQRARAGQPTLVPVHLVNGARRFPAFAVETEGRVQGPASHHVAAGPFQLRLAPLAEVDIGARFVPASRGRHEVVRLVAQTAYPFGFFEKMRRFRSAEPVEFWVMPKAVEVSELASLLVARLGEEAARTSGRGEDFFSLRPYREGDDLRRVHWRRSARTGRWVVKETEAMRGSRVLLELVLGDLPLDNEAAPRVEHTIAVLGSLAEALAAQGLAVGAHGPGLAVPAAAGTRQAYAVLAALARVQPTDPWPHMAAAGAHRIAVVAPGAHAPRGVDAVIEAPEPPGTPVVVIG
jgi:uncharacterized protein (DUF58 family)